jgi:excisionase family DNA binding protein
MRRPKEACRQRPIHPQRLLPTLRVEIDEAAQILRISRSRLYQHVRDGRLELQKDGVRSFVTMEELTRFVAAQSK